MGREIRMVPPNWDHPKVIRSNGEEGYQPMFDRRFEDESEEWKNGLYEWEYGVRPEYFTEDEDADIEYWEHDGGPPDRAYYRPWKDEDATWYQVWETVSEGTPVSPPFATQEELVDYLVENGDFWDQSRRKKGCTTMNCDPWKREHAERFVKVGSAPSMVHDSKGLRSGVEALADLTNDPE